LTLPNRAISYAQDETGIGSAINCHAEQEVPITVKNFMELAEASRKWTDPRTRSKSRSHL